MVIDFSKLDLHKKPNFILRNFDGNAISVLGNIMNATGEIKYNEISKIDFIYPSQINGSKLEEYDFLTGMKIIDVEGIGQFILHNPEAIDDGIVERKKCSGYSLEYEFTNKSISLEEGVYCFWNPLHPYDTVLGIILSEMPSWSIGTISNDLIGKYRTFSVNGISIYDFMKTTLEKTFECVFEFDTYHRKINVRSNSALIPTKPVYLTTSNLVKEITVQESTDDLFTVLDVYGADGVDIRSVNPTGGNKIYNLDTYMTNEYFSPDIISKWKRWKSTFNANQDLYYQFVIELNIRIAEQSAEEAILNDLNGELTTLEAKKAALLQAVSIDKSMQTELNSVNSQIRSKNSEIDKQRLTLSKIEGQIKNCKANISKINKETALSSFFSQDEIVILDRYFKCGTLTDSTFVANDTGSFTSESTTLRGITDHFFITSLSEIKSSSRNGLKFYTIRGGELSQTNVSNNYVVSDIVNATLQVESNNTFVMTAYLNNGYIDLKKPNKNQESFKNATLILTGKLSGSIKNDAALGSNIHYFIDFSVYDTTLYLTYDVTEFQRMSVAWDLYEYGKEILSRKSNPTYHFTIDSSNFFAIDDFVSFAKEFSLGERIYLHMNMGVIQPLVTGVQIDFDNLSSLELEFASDFQVKDGKISWLDNLNQSISIGKTLDLKQFNYSNFVNSGANTRIKDFMDSALNAMKNMILSGTNEEIVIDGTGLRARKYDEKTKTYSPKQLWLTSNALMFTTDNWNTGVIGIGEFVDKNLGSLYGIVAPAIVGTILAGNSLILESQKTDGGIAVFKVDGEGASLHNASFNLYGNSGGRIDLGATFGIVCGNDKNTLFNYNSKGQPIGVRTYSGKSVVSIDQITSGDQPNANFWLDMKGNAYFRGEVQATKGTFSGELKAATGTFKGALQAATGTFSGELKAATGTFKGALQAATGTFSGELKAAKGTFNGSISGASGTFKGTIQAARFLDSNGRDMMSAGKFKADYLDLKGITIRDNTGKVSFQVSSNGSVTIGGTVTGNITLGAGSSINWATVTEKNLSSSSVYQMANSALSQASDAYERADDAVDAANNAANWAYSAYDYADFVSQKAIEEARSWAMSKEEIFDALTDEGTKRGLFTTEYGELYICADYIGSGVINTDIITLEGSRGGGLCTGKGDYFGERTNAVTLYGPDDNYYVIVSTRGIRLQSPGHRLVVTSNSVTVDDAIVQTSDRNLKKDILYDMSQYENFFMDLKPTQFKYRNGQSGRFHTGFISQDVGQALLDNGLDTTEFAGFVVSDDESDDGNYYLRYGEFVSLNTYMIQKLYKRMKMLENRVSDLENQFESKRRNI